MQALVGLHAKGIGVVLIDDRLLYSVKGVIHTAAVLSAQCGIIE